MNKKYPQGIGLILFGILLCLVEEPVNNTLLHSFSDFPFFVLGICFGAAGLFFLFSRGEGE